MVNRSLAGLVLVLALAGLGSRPARADEFSYRLGRQLGERTAASAWLNLRGASRCLGVQDLHSVLMRSTRRLGRSASRFDRPDLIDYSRGYLRGLWVVFAQVADRCPSRCGTLSSAAESLSSAVYAEVVRLIGHVPRSIWRQDLPRGFCGRG
jgi:hypothetical protein